MTGRHGTLAVLLAVSMAVAFFAVGYPMYVIRPFRAQGANELQAALALRSWAPLVAGAASVIAIVAARLLWMGSRRTLSRVLSVTAAAFTLLFTALTHFNIFEKMFHRIDSPDTIAASEATLEGDDMVISIRIAGQARAYPIRMMGYHHIVNDIVGGVPVAGTY